MTALLIKDGRIINPAQGLDRVGSLLLADGKVSWVGSGGTPALECEILDAEGLVISPGFIDLHCHLRQPGFEEKETIASGTRAAARGGFTTVCCMPNTSPPLDSPDAIDYVKSVALAEGAVSVLPIGCISKGRRGEELADLSGMASAGAVAFSDDGSPVMDSLVMRRALEESRKLKLPVISHCEDTYLSRGGFINEGEISARLGLRGIPAAAEEAMVARDLILAGLTGGRLHIAHVSTRGSVELIRHARKKCVNVTAEVTPHHLTLTEASVIGYNTSAKVNPPLRTGRDIEALIQGLKDGVIDAIATDHAPHTESDKCRSFAEAPFGISALETAFGSLMSLVHAGHLSLDKLIAKLTCEPAKIIGMPDRLGTLAVGAEADVTIFDPDREWVVDTDSFASKGKNTPLAGATLKGKVVATISRGKLVYKDETLKLTLKIGREQGVLRDVSPSK